VRGERLRLLPWFGGAFVLLGLLLMMLSGLSFVFPDLFTFVLPGATRTPEPLIPTRTPDFTVSTSPPDAHPGTSHDASWDASWEQSQAQGIVPPDARFRLGVSLPYGASGPYDLQALGVGWVMDWQAQLTPVLSPGIEYVQMVRMRQDVLDPSAETLTAIAARNPGATWLISNEPDVRWQDNVLPATYAQLYHVAYWAIKAGDPTAIVAAGGIAQPSALRFRYLDLVLEAYAVEFGEPLPAQAWQIHNYMLREERDSWGVDIPPGIPDDTGVLYEIDDSGNLEAFRQQIVDFRRWMVARGYAGQPLIVSEFGVPMPEDYGFPLERMATFMRETWSFFLTAADPALGNPEDGGRLVQRWCWFSMGYPLYPTGNLIDLETGAWTPLARVWMSYVNVDE